MQCADARADLEVAVQITLGVVLVAELRVLVHGPGQHLIVSAWHITEQLPLSQHLDCMAVIGVIRFALQDERIAGA